MQHKVSFVLASLGTALVLAGAGCSSSPTLETTPPPAAVEGTGSNSSANVETTNPAAQTPTPTDSGTGTETSKGSPDTTKPVTQEKTFTLADVQAANTEANCLSAINGKVYNLTKWINQHPGGDRAILSICGKDGSAAFNGKHGGQMRPEQILAGFEVGTLK